jgi:protein-L-isoaspartate(D-aspartate) O-methyltransferase
LKRRDFVSGTAAVAASSAIASLASPAFAATIKPYSWDLNPPTDTREHFIEWGKARGEDPGFLGQRWDRCQALLRNKDLWSAPTIRAFLLTPREEFASVRPQIHKHAYDHAFLDIGYGVTMSGPHLQGRMTNVLEVKRGDKVLEIGTGSGVQSAYIANLTENAYTIEIIKPLAERTRALYDKLIEKGYTEYQHIKSKAADGYYGWEEAAPFDKIIVTCGIDHVPPPLLQQLKSGGLMVIPVGPPGAQRVAEIGMQCRIVGIGGERQAMVRDRGLELADQAQRHAEIVVQLGVIGPERQQAQVGLDRLVEPAGAMRLRGQPELLNEAVGLEERNGVGRGLPAQRMDRRRVVHGLGDYIKNMA